MHIASHFLSAEIGRFFEAVGHKVDSITQVWLCGTHEPCQFQQSGHTAGIVIGSRLVPCHIVMSTHDKSLHLIWVEGHDNIPVWIPSGLPFLFPGLKTRMSEFPFDVRFRSLQGGEVLMIPGRFDAAQVADIAVKSSYFCFHKFLPGEYKNGMNPLQVVKVIHQFKIQSP